MLSFYLHTCIYVFIFLSSYMYLFTSVCMCYFTHAPNSAGFSCFAYLLKGLRLRNHTSVIRMCVLHLMIQLLQVLLYIRAVLHSSDVGLQVPWIASGRSRRACKAICFRLLVWVRTAFIIAVRPMFCQQFRRGARLCLTRQQVSH